MSAIAIQENGKNEHEKEMENERIKRGFLKILKALKMIICVE
jgi:hypothetical protein